MKKKEKESPKPKRNIQSDGTAEDLIRSFIQFGCAEGHVKTLIEKYTAELENGIIDPTDSKKVNEQTQKIDDMTQELNSLAEIRRGIMLRLFSMYEGDKDFWCLVKHIGVGTYNLFEAYQASEDDPELYVLYLEANKRFVKSMTYFLGMEITECSACFADFIKGEQHG